MWRKRLWETFAIIATGDGVIEVLAPREHSLLWQVGPGKGVARFFADNPKHAASRRLADRLRSVAHSAPIS